MIASLSGILKSKGPTEVLLDVNGVGYAISIPLSTFEKLGNVNSHASLFTYLHVREDALQLFGFATEEERRFFKLLISVSGIGPRIAQSILSGMSVGELRQHLVNGNVSALTAIPNVGRKTAERLIVELRDTLGKQEIDVAAFPTNTSAEIRSETLLALTSLGYNRAAAEKAIRSALREASEAALSVEELLKKALRHTNLK